MPINIKIEVFEGPLDLLFHLIEKSEINIYDIPISEITNQYLVYLLLMEELDLEIASEFMLMAATLIEIKSKMLLPKPPKEEAINYLDPREELVRKLLEYKQYKEASAILKEKMDVYEKIFYKDPDPIEMHISDLNDYPDMNAQILFNSLKNILANQKQIENENNTVRLILKDKLTIEQKLYELETLLQKNKSFYFEHLFSNSTTKYEIIVTFLALLELMKRHIVTLEQDKNFDIILIKSI